MGAIVTIKITRFDGGIKNDPRDQSENTCRVVTGFDVLTDPKRMSPYRDSEDGGPNSIADDKRNFVMALWEGSSPDEWRLFGLGATASGGVVAEVAMKSLGTTGGGDGDLADNTWLQPAANASASGSMNENLFVYYRRAGKILGARAETNIWAFTPDGSTAFDDSFRALTYTQIFQGVVHSKDDRLYIPYYNSGGAANAKSFIARFQAPSTWDNTILTLPDHLIPITICEYGNFLAIGCAPISGVGNSRVFLWDRDSSFSTLSESIDWGDGNLMILEEVNGELIGISQTGGTAAVLGLNNDPISVPSGSTSFTDRIIFKRYLGGNKVEKITELLGTNNTTYLPVAKQKINNRLYFMMRIILNGTSREGVWSIGKNEQEEFIIIHERTPNNNTALAGSFDLHSFIFVGDFLFQSYSTSGAYALSKTNDASSFTASSIYESKRFNGNDSGRNKKLISVGVMTEALPSGAQIVLSYMINGETTYTTIFTQTVYDTDDIDYLSIYHEAINIESSGATLPTFREISFRIASTGNAVVTGLKFKYEEINDEISF